MFIYYLWSSYLDECYTTDTWVPASTYECPDMCTQYGPDYDGNVNDPGNPHHYVACWKGVTMGCVACPGNLMFNMRNNSCMYDGEHYTMPMELK